MDNSGFAAGARKLGRGHSRIEASPDDTGGAKLGTVLRPTSVAAG
jgi:hypothetical protein